MAGRPEAPIDPGEPFADFANGLRALRAESGKTYEQLASKAHFCVAVLSMAANGRQLPTLPVALAYVRACGGSESDCSIWSSWWTDLHGRGD
jgi:hypothetical protein